MDFRYSLFTDNPDNQAEYIGASNNIGGDPNFVHGYLNGPRDLTLVFAEGTVLQTAAAFDEGGNFIQVGYGPLSQVDSASPPPGTVLFDYHIGAPSAALDAGTASNLNNWLMHDIDHQPRPNGNVDIGADER